MDLHLQLRELRDTLPFPKTDFGIPRKDAKRRQPARKIILATTERHTFEDFRPEVDICISAFRCRRASIKGGNEVRQDWLQKGLPGDLFRVSSARIEAGEL